MYLSEKTLFKYNVLVLFIIYGHVLKYSILFAENDFTLLYLLASCLKMHMNKVATAFLLSSVYLSWVMSKECQWLAWLALLGATQSYSASTALHPTVWATRAQSSAREINSDHLLSIEGITTLCKWLSINLYSDEHKHISIAGSSHVVHAVRI